MSMTLARSNAHSPTPIAIERIALTGCRNRVDADLAGSPLIFKDVAVNEDGTLADVDSPAVAAAIDELYKRFTLRRATEEEVAHLRGLYAEALEINEPNPARAWGIASCFAVATSLESLFY